MIVDAVDSTGGHISKIIHCHDYNYNLRARRDNKFTKKKYMGDFAIGEVMCSENTYSLEK